jgi:dipeptidyl aminopeptidase/acylaminoacyl peptidase
MFYHSYRFYFEDNMINSFDFQTFLTSRGKQLEYLLSVPNGFKVGASYPILLALPPGDQTREMAMVYGAWLPYFQQQGWVVCSPVAPDGKLFFRGSERYLPQIMGHIESQVIPAGGKFYLFGISNGGISVFRVATLNPERFHSLTVLPGWPKPADENRLDKVLDMPINFLVGEMDSHWRENSELYYKKISQMGGDVWLEVIPGEGHMAFHSFPVQRLIQIIQRNCK